MGHKNHKSLVRQVQERLEDQLRIGQSKYAAQKSEGTQHPEGIFSYETFRTYMKHCNYFAAWAKEEHGCRSLDAARPYVDEWLASRSGLSASTVKMEASALAKLYGCSTRDFVATRSRHRADITRSRGEAARDRHFSKEKNAELVNFCRCTGLRRAELESLRPDQLQQREDGAYFLEIKGKGGRVRLAPIVGTQEQVQAVVNRIQAAQGKVWGKVHSAADIHAYRAEYATRVYEMHARPVDEIPKDAAYHCRGDLKGVVYDKAAMRIASEALGHNRISVIAGHYIRG